MYRKNLLLVVLNIADAVRYTNAFTGNVLIQDAMILPPGINRNYVKRIKTYYEVVIRR